MNILLIKNVPKLGTAGKVVNVADGYARNFLLPNKFGVIATNTAISKVRLQADKAKKELEKSVIATGKLAKKIANKEFTVKKPANEQGTLFAGLSEQEIAGLISSATYSVSPNEIILKEHIKKVGRHKVGVNFNNSANVTIFINIEAE